jgi:hypothetical protein
MKEKIINLLGGYTKKDIAKYNANILNQFQLQGTSEMPFVAYDERICLVPAIEKAMDLLDNTNPQT